MVTAADISALAVARGIDIRRDSSEVIVATSTTVPALIDLVEELDLVVLGLDGLQADGAVVVPLMDFIADFSEVAGSWSDRVRDSASAARGVLAAWGAGADFIELTVDGLDE